MLTVCETLREVDAKATRLGLVRTETDYIRALLDAMADMDRYVEVEVLKSLGDVNLEKGRLYKDLEKFDRAMMLYRTALIRCEDAYVGDRITYRYRYAEKLIGKVPRASISSSNKKIPSLPKVVEKFLNLDRSLSLSNKDSVLFEYTKLMIEGIVNRDSMLEVEAVKSIGDVYLNTGRKTGDTMYLTKATAMYNTALSRTCDKDLTEGDHALTEGNLDLAEQKFASALKLIHDFNIPDRPKEAECLYRIGNVYVKRGKRTKEGRNFTQAAALYNAAMARTDENRDKMMRCLQETEQLFLMHIANVDSKLVSSDGDLRHKERFESMRTRVKSQLEAIDQKHNPYQYNEDDPKMRTVEAERAEAVKALFKSIAKDRQMFIQDLVRESVKVLGPPPCKYAFIGLGSQATELVTPYSDLEFAILIEDGRDNDDTREYFINLTHYLHLKVINLGETILPAMAIPSLNDFQSEDPEKDWFFDSVTPRGFAFDGFMPWASKTPFGRDKTKTKPPVSLIQTPVNLAKFQRHNISMSEGYHLSDILRRVSFLAGEETLISEYMEKLGEIITDSPISRLMSRLSAIVTLWDDKDHLSNLEPTGQLLNVKKDIYRFPGIAIELLALCCQFATASTWDVIDKFKETDLVEEQNATHLTILTSISAELRLRTYIVNGGQNDTLSPLTEIEYQPKVRMISYNTLRSVFHIPDNKVLFRYYCRAIPLKRCMPDIINKTLPLEPIKIFKTAIYDDSNECMGRIAGNLLLSDKSLQYWEAALREAESEVKRSEILEELGRYWASHDDIAKGRTYFEQSLMIRRNIYGETAHPDIVLSLLNIGTSFSRLGDQKKAIGYFQQSLTMTEMLYGDCAAHPNITKTLCFLGYSWSKLGDQNKAINFYEKAVTIMRNIYGDNTAHPDIAASLLGLGECWGELGDQTKAISYCEQSITMRKTIYGDNTAHPGIIGALCSLGLSWSKLGDQNKAIRFHQQALTVGKTIYGDKTTHPYIFVTLGGLGLCWHELGDDKKAISYYEQSLAMEKTIYGDNKVHPSIAVSLINLGYSWSSLGDEKKAINYFEQSVAMVKSIYGEITVHPNIARSLHGLGSCWSKLGEERKAIEYYHQSLTMEKSIYSDETAHPSIAASLRNLGASYSRLGDQNKAIKCFEQSLKMTKIIYGDNTAHPDVAALLTNLGLCCRQLGDQRKAIYYHERALTMLRIIHEDHAAHPNIAGALNNIGMSWSELGDDKKAVSYYEQSLTMRKFAYGDMHPDTAESLNNLGASWKKLGDQKKAIRHHEQSLQIGKAIYGDNTAHPKIARSLNNLGSCWNKLGDHQKAIIYFEQSLKMQRAIHGENIAHPDIATLLYNTGSSWRILGHPKKAISYLEQSLMMLRTIYGDNTAHLDIASSLRNLGVCWWKCNDQRKAVSYYEQSLEMRKTMYGHNTAHPDIATSLNNLGLSYSKLGDETKAISFYEQSLRMLKTVHGENKAHPDVIKALRCLASCWSKLGDQRKASRYYEELLILLGTVNI
uniref:Protein-PII uridylyltransferase N-terminal domain-containing protein n=1 Tax=Branchiostoma floridae TaxID=7739 RepID=C3Y7C0_BRAFL|eukprot:XP_002607738.1 hypothetical protein BRAFLDRAFT_82815 [Branchiostoma floridae]